MIEETGRVTTPDGLALFWRASLPPRPRGVLVFVHGLLEHSGRYRNPVRHFVPRDWACYGYDTRSHGQSPGVKMHVERFDDFLVDLAAVLALVRARHPDLPVFLVGHSHGGLVVLHHALRHPALLPGIVVSSPFLAVHPSVRPNALLRAAISLLSHVAPRLMFPQRIDPSAVSRDPEVCAAYASDPDNGRQFSVRWAAQAMQAQRSVLLLAPQLAVPTLLMAGGCDTLVDTEATRRFAATAPAHLVELVVWPDCFHELFNEPEKQQVFDRMENWLAARQPPVPPGC